MIYLPVTSHQKTYYLLLDEIVYIKTDVKSHSLRVQTDNDTFVFYGSLNDLEEKIQSFFRCHRSYLLNLDKVKLFDKKEHLIYLRDERLTTIPCARVRVGALLERLEERSDVESLYFRR